MIDWKESHVQEAYDAKGKPIRETIHTAHLKGGVLRVTPDPDGTWSWFLYDDAGTGLQDMRIDFPTAEDAKASAERILSP